MSGSPLVSIVIPVYNGSDYVRSAIDSALSQTYASVEIVVVNDGSTDGGKTDQICRAYGERIVYLSKENGGVASALNAGIKKARGEYISWLSHDDMYVADKIERQMASMARYIKTNKRKCILYGNYVSIDVVENKRYKVLNPKIGSDAFYESIMSLGGFLHGCTTLIPVEAFDAAGYFDEGLRTTQDTDMWLRLNAFYDFVQMGDFLVESRDHPAQGSKTLKALHERETSQFFERALDYFVDSKDNPRFGIERYGFLVLSLKQRGYIGAYNRALKIWREKGLALKGHDLLCMMYAMFYNRHLAVLRVYDAIDRLLIGERPSSW